jgi:diguanylate cyclase (GGDEF)-like protein/PAS domain S-box-containing protein
MTDKVPTARKSRRRVADRSDRRTENEASAPDFRALVDDAVQGVLIHRNFKPLYANRAFAELFGYHTVRDILALPLLRRLVPDDVWQRLEVEYDEMMRGTRKSIVGRSRGIRKDGGEIWVAVTMRVIDWQGADAIMLTAFDITKQVELEHGMLKNEQKLRAILEILPYPIYVARRSDGQLLFVNRKSCLLFQQSTGQLLRAKSTDFYVDGKERESMAKLLDSVADIRDVEVKMKTGQGRNFIAEIAAIPLDYNNSPAVLVALNDVSQRKEMEAELFRQASTDSLTGISNRRYFLNLAEQEMRRARRFAREMTVMMIDIDHFKAANDTYGHATGDAVLQGVVKRAIESLRQSDSIGRVGGEEFAVLLPETGLAAAYDVADRLRQHMGERPIIADKIAVGCTVSIGVAQLSAQDSNMDDLLHRADMALYEAKNSGRNKVVISSTQKDEDTKLLVKS